MKKVVAIIAGTRPEVIKTASLWFALKASERLQPLLISTGQHREMLAQTFAVFGMKPDVDLELMQSAQPLADLTSRVLTSITTILRKRRPDAMLVQGDTTTVLGATLAAFYERIPVGHVEAGLRTYNYEAPWPEEMNRRLADQISTWCFAPTATSAANLRAENIPLERIYVTGNTVVDALEWVRRKLARQRPSPSDIAARCGIPADFARAYLSGSSELNSEAAGFDSAKRWVLVTGHRRESFGRGFENICRAIATLAEHHPGLGILYPVHLNPNVQEPVRRLLGGIDRIALLPPLGYEDFVWLLERAFFVLSDSGGVQEEAPTFGKPVLVMRDTTERPDGVEAGVCRLVGTDPAVILREAGVLLGDPAEYKQRAARCNPYGDGKAAERIVAQLERDIGLGA